MPDIGYQAVNDIVHIVLVSCGHIITLVALLDPAVIEGHGVYAPK